MPTTFCLPTITLPPARRRMINGPLTLPNCAFDSLSYLDCSAPTADEGSNQLPPTAEVESYSTYATRSMLGTDFLSGARLKITRSWIPFKSEDGSKPLLDIGVGASLDMDRQRLLPVARLKIKDFLVVKACPLGVVKLAKSVHLGDTGLAARLILDSCAGSGLHMSPTGIEFDEKLLRLGESLSIRGSMGLTFPRSLPVDLENDDWGFKVHRLSLKTLW
eukprot:gene16782-23058_t